MGQSNVGRIQGSGFRVSAKKFAVPDSGYSEGGDKVSVVTRNRFGP